MGWSPLLWGMSYENIVPVVLGLSVIGQHATNSSTARTPSLIVQRLHYAILS
eukprot:SAG31_NODE_8670_length_1410_cov_1.341724_1_plen_51_part_10